MGGLVGAGVAADTITEPVMLEWMAQWYGKVPAVGNAMALLVAPDEMLPVFQAPVSEVAVCVGPVALVQLTVEPAVMRMGFGLKHHGVVAAQFTI
ncbi:MAG: hypothetical protein M3Z28_03965 [Candidatus Dormibacteraeota bacterium]|nr:hypothetical protein [Candidatus Dormibacteraeota bacterium]